MFWQVLEMHTWELATLPCFVHCLCVLVCGLRCLCVFGRAEEGFAAWHRRITKTKARTVLSHVQKVDEAREAASLKRAVARESLIEAVSVVPRLMLRLNSPGSNVHPDFPITLTCSEAEDPVSAAGARSEM